MEHSSSHDQHALASRIIVVIPTLNEADHIEACMESLFADAVSLRDVSVIICDGGSHDNTVMIIRALEKKYPKVQLLHNPKKLQSAAINLAAKAADENRDIMLRCDCHAIYPENYILNIAESFLHHDCDSLVISMDAYGTDCFQKANAWIVDTPLGSGGAPHRGGMKSGYVDHGHHAAFSKKKFIEVGGYDESFSHNEDAEYDFRLKKQGGKIYLDATIRIKYIPRSNILSLWKQYFGYGKGRIQNLTKHHAKPKLRQIIPVLHCIAFVGSICLLPFSIFGFLWPFSYGILIGIVSLWFCISKKSLCGLYSGIALAVMHFAWGSGALYQYFIHRYRGAV